MILLGYDVESTGTDLNKDRVIEVGLVLFSTGQRRVLESSGFLVQSDGVEITQEITEITGITQAASNAFGYDTKSAVEDVNDWIAKADYVVAHNGTRFDKPMTENWAKRLGVNSQEKVWIDPMVDIPGVKGEQLVTMCAKKGFLYDAHGAFADANAVTRLLSIYDKEGVSFDSVVERAKCPTLLIRSHQDRNNNDDAKKLKFRWSPSAGIWWKSVKEQDIQELVNNAPFKISVLDKDVTFEDLDN